MTTVRAAKPATPAKLWDLIRATLAEYFPKCEHASLVFVPAPGVSSVELIVSGDVLTETGLGDAWTSDARGGVWEPDDAG